MQIKVGCIIKGKFKFKNGGIAKYGRPYLVVKVTSTTVDLVNISSTSGKEWKLLMKSNMSIENYNPPLDKQSFVKLDSRITVSQEDLTNIKPWNNGILCETEVNKILKALANFEQGTL